MAKKPRQTPAVFVRRRAVENPGRLLRVIQLYTELCQSQGTGRIVNFHADGMPRSMNGLWHVRADGRGFKDAKTKSFEQKLHLAGMEVMRKPIHGTCALVLAIESSSWLQQDNAVRDKDIDNYIKSPVDAVKRHLGGDHLVWEVLNFKIQSTRDRTHVWIFEFGDIVDCYQPPAST